MLQKLTRWDDRLALEVALHLEGSGDTLPDILNHHRLTALDLDAFNKDPLFQRRVEGFRDDIKNKGLSFKLKARVQAEQLLQTSFDLIHHPDISAAVKADLIKSTVKWAGLEPKGSDEAGGPAGGVKITINLGQSPQDRRTIDVTPVVEAIGAADESYEDY
jgi:hypothetical protein